MQHEKSVRLTNLLLILCVLFFLLSCTGKKKAAIPTPKNENGVITAEEWKAYFPEIVDSYRMNDENNYRVDYREQDPYIITLYTGFGFAKDYTSAIGHTYTLEDCKNTERPHPLANCLTCKTPDFTKLVNDMGIEAYKLDFNATLVQMNENVSCYNCHANEAANNGKLVITHSYVKTALGDTYLGIDEKIMTCGQCHVEYYFDPETKATTVPYHSIEGMNAQSILKFYDDIGFSDFTNPATKTPMLKAQHPEFETFLTEGSKHKDLGITCASCHMPHINTPDGKTFVSHKWQSPLESEELLATCVKCHGKTDMKAMVKGIQAEITALERKAGLQCETLNKKIAEGIAAGTIPDDKLKELQNLYRQAQWYWDYVYVENSEGAHNSAYARKTLNQSLELSAKALQSL